MNRIPVALFPNRAMAEPVQKRLADCGIGAEIHEELRLEKLWFVSRPDCGARLEVPDGQFKKSACLLDEWEASEPAMREAVHCPECKSLRVQYPQSAHHSIMTNLFLGLAAELNLVDRQYFCEGCHYTWPKEETLPHRERPHSAPNYFIE